MLEIETEPLTEQPHSSSSRRPYENGDSPSHQQPNRFHLSPRWQKFLVALAIACIFMFFYNSETAEENIEGGVYTEKKNGTSPTSNTTSSYTGISNTDKDTTSTTGSSSTSTAAATTTGGITANVLEGEKLVQLVKQQREKFEAKLKQDYGEENFRNIFQYHNETTGQYLSRGRQAYGTPERISWSRMKRKLMIKILTAQIGMHTTRQRKRRQLLSLRENSNNNYRQRQLQQSSETDGYLAKFVWANGGHSSSAGHGNFYWESYTAVMERGIKPYFEALGIEFIGKNYAMGGTSSGEEIALCTDSVFGTDIDALTWDFGMTDAGQKEQWKQLLYTYHTAHGRNRPAAVGIEVSLDSTRTKIYDQMEEMGMITFYRDSKLYTAMQHSFPDTQGLNDAEINAMPPLVQKLKCGDGIEKGDPGCGDAKYNETACQERKGKASWHPGWKIHALQGNTLALFLGEVLVDAAEELASLPESEDLKELLNRLIAEEEHEYANIINSPVPPMLSPIANWMLGSSDDDKMLGDINVHEFYLKRSFCHTALLPAEMRFLGLLTQSDKKGFTTYDTGIPQPAATDIPTEIDTGDMRLAYDPKDHENACPYNVGVDFKDFFFLSSVEGWKTLTFPNDAEKQYYDVEPSNMLGIIMICLATCDWNQCKGGDLRDEFDKGPLSMEVNGVAVAAYDKVGICWALKGAQNGYRWTPNAQGVWVYSKSLFSTSQVWENSDVQVLFSGHPAGTETG